VTTKGRTVGFFLPGTLCARIDRLRAADVELSAGAIVAAALWGAVRDAEGVNHMVPRECIACGNMMPDDETAPRVNHGNAVILVCATCRARSGR
jgi:predicted RNA-binding Zn-ribbon protein involved in translation (DUF1610 family)